MNLYCRFFFENAWYHFFCYAKTILKKCALHMRGSRFLHIRKKLIRRFQKNGSIVITNFMKNSKKRIKLQWVVFEVKLLNAYQMEKVLVNFPVSVVIKMFRVVFNVFPKRYVVESSSNLSFIVCFNKPFFELGRSLCSKIYNRTLEWTSKKAIIWFISSSLAKYQPPSPSIKATNCDPRFLSDWMRFSCRCIGKLH